VKGCSASRSGAEDLILMVRGGFPRPDFVSRDGRGRPRVLVERVLCWWCREFHSPSEVEHCMKIPDRRAGASNGTGSSSSVLDAGVLMQFSELWAFLMGTDTVTGQSRKSGSLSLKFVSGLLGLTLNDAETSQYCFLQGSRLDDLLLQAELGLSDGSLPWRASQGPPRGRR